MDGTSRPYFALRALAPVAALALLSGTSGTLAQEAELAAHSPAIEEQEAPFDTAFVPFAEPIEPALPDHAVDITTIEPAAPSATPIGPGVASYYGRRFHGRLTANGERFDMNAMTAAHKTLPFGSRVRVTNARNGKSVVVRINDRGPFVRGRHIDLSRAAAQEIGIIRTGHGNVELELLDD